MASSATAPTLLENLPARPPTPPRETHIHEPSELLIKSLPGRPSPLNPRLSLSTPPSAESPASAAATNSVTQSGRMEKRVGWSAHTEYRDPPTYQNVDKFYKSSPLSAPSSASSKPLKGILKPSSSPNPLASTFGRHFDGTGDQVNITEMLDSTIKQLAGSDRDSKLDAYMMLSRALKASNNLPDRVALQDKMSLLMQFIQRDITSKNENGTLDTSLVNHALNLLATFLHFQAIASTITTDFAVFLIDHSIRSFEDSSLPKDVLRHFMQVVAFQNFASKIMTADRVGRLVNALHNIEDHLKGKSIVMSRIQIYKRLVKQSRSHMAVHAEWLMDMFTDMLSSIKDIRAQAISLGMEAGYAFRPGNQLMRKVSEVLQASIGDQAYIDFYIQKLQEMVKDKQRSSSVPQIWSVVVLFLRCPLDKWEHYAPWFSLIQTAFNTSDIQTKQEANYAWNRYVFLCLTENRPTTKLLMALSTPLMSQLRRRTNPKHIEETTRLRRTVIGGLCNLYYYAFRPGSERISPPEVPWDIAVQPVVAQLLGLDGTREARPDDINQASSILVGLLDVSTPVVWREDRIVDLPPVKPDELPSIESKWIRKSSERIFKAIDPIIEKKFLDLANKESLTYRLWQAIVGSIAAASAKDIKVSEDTAKFFACSFGLLSKIWTKGCDGDKELLVSKFFPSVCNFVQILVKGLGALPFTEKKLSMTVGNMFEPVATPSHRPDKLDKSQGVVRTPLQHLFTMLSSTPEGASDDEAFSEFFQSVFEPFFVGKNTKGRLELTKELLRLLPQNTLAPFAPWCLGGQALQASLLNSTVQGAQSGDKMLGPELREVVSFLERGLVSHPKLPQKHWLALFNALSEHVTSEFGDAGRAILVTEPLAKYMLGDFQSDAPLPSSRTLEAARAVFSSAKLPKDCQALDVARRRIWGPVAANSTKGSSLDPFDALYKFANAKLKYFYDRISELDADTTIAPFIESIAVFLKDSCQSTGFASLSKLEDGLSLWLRDDKSQLKLGQGSVISITLRELWNKIFAEITRPKQLDRSQFDQVEGFLTAAFNSKHRSIINQAAEAWNTVVKDEENIECSDSLKSVVSSLQSRVEIFVPGVEQSSGEGEFGAQASSLLGPPADPSPVALSSAASNEVQPSLNKTTPASEKLSQSAKTRKRRLETTPEVLTRSKRLTRSSRTSTPRLRHDNSQIQFEPIASSSPVPEDSQHLTERQKEIRERQKENAVIYSDAQSGSPAAHTAVSDEKPTETNHDVAQQDATPDHASSYGELISSTPTPRRGQLIPMDVDNDPPSSPPEPRPYPLLSEIRSRSRASSSLEDWSFSSPPSSPVTSRQQVAQDAEPFRVALTDGSTQSHTASQKRRRRSRRTKKHSQSPDVIPSSAPESDRVDIPLQGSFRKQEAPTTPPRRHLTATVANAQGTPKSGEDEFVDARSNPERSSSPALPEMPNDMSKELSFALSEGDESQLMKFVVELESRKCNLPLDKYSSVSPDKRPHEDAVRECITVQTDSSASEHRGVQESNKAETLPEAIPSTPAEPIAEPTEEDVKSSPSGRQAKRKRGAKNQDSRGKKKRRSSANFEASQGTAENKSQDKESVSSPMQTRRSSAAKPVTGVRTRRSARQQQQQEEVAERVETEPEGNGTKEDGDTDEELMSQLMNESNAASQSQDDTGEVIGLEATSTIHDSMDVGSTDDKAVEESNKPALVEQKGSETNNDTESILDKLKGGLAGLRNASLVRADVYKIEDMLMDIKRELFEAERRGRGSV